MRKFVILTAVLLVAMMLMAGTASANLTGAGWANSNRSGETTVSWDGGALLRNVPAQLTHTDFRLNTNSCASCHMTHTAVGTNLLIAATTQDTCMACHNGTIGFLNVQATASGTVHNAGMGGSVAAGTFSLDAGRTPSMHNVFSGVTISGAPGGNRSVGQLDPRTGVREQGATWDANFTCASCHAPHGSHSIRLLHFNPNNVALRPVIDAVYGVNGGRYTVSTATNVNLAVYTEGINTVTGATYFMYSLSGGLPAAPWVAGYSHAHNIPGRTAQFWTRVYHAVYWNPNTQGFADPTANVGATNAPMLLTRFFTINFAAGQVIQNATQRNDLITWLNDRSLSHELRIDVARGLQVRARADGRFQTGGAGAIADAAGPAAAAGNLVAAARRIDFIDPATYDAPAYNLFCAACHTDYLPTVSAGSQTGSGVGFYSSKFRHTINRGASTAVSPMPVRGSNTWSGANLTGSTGTGTNRLMCLSCHFAHGVDASMMLLANNTRVSAGTGAVGTETHSGQNDVSQTLGGSSALKRYINQASCWHCHVRSSAMPFQNTTYYWNTFPQGPTW